MNRFLVVVFAAVVLLFSGSPLAYADAPTKLTGEVIDTYCYAAMGAKGESHRECGIKCAKKGIPVGLLEDGTNKIYVLLPNKDDTALSDDVINKMGKKATVTGHAYASGGSQFFSVDSVS